MYVCMYVCVSVHIMCMCVLFDLAYFFLPSFSRLSLKHVCVYVSMCVHVCVQ